MQLIKEDQEIAQFIEKEYNERILPAFLQLIEEGRKNGEISDKISNEGLIVFINLSMKYTNEFYDLIQQTGNMNLINEMLHIFLYGICGKE